MLPPDVEPIARPRRGDGAGIGLALAYVFTGGSVGLIIGLLIGWGTL